MRNLALLMIFPLIALGQASTFKIEEEALLQDALVSYYVAEADSGTVLSAYQKSKNMAPASVLKLFSTAVALDELGPDYRQESTIYHSGNISGETLIGDLVFDPNFNPTLGAMRFGENLTLISTELLSFLSSKGIKSIQGKVKVLERVTVPERIPRTWIWEDMGNYYGAGGGSVSWNENIFELVFSSGAPGEPAKLIKTSPELPFIQVDCQVQASMIDRDLAYCFSRPGDDRISVSGTIPAHQKYFVVKAALPQPALCLAHLLTKSLLKAGIMIQGDPEAINRLPLNVETIGSFKSATVKEIVEQTNLNSVNFYAEALLEIAYQHSGSKDLKLDWFQYQLSQSFEVNTSLLFDASGLSRFNAVSSQQVVTLLRNTLAKDQRGVFENSLSVVGQSGTLKSLLRKTSANGFIKGKSGSMTGVRCYAGLVTAVSGKRYVFALMLNNYEASYSGLKPLIEKFMLSLFEQ